MLIVRTPFRISFLGGGTDVREYYEKFNGGGPYYQQHLTNTVTIS